jgi:hypothetical protein
MLVEQRQAKQPWLPGSTGRKLTIMNPILSSVTIAALALAMPMAAGAADSPAGPIVLTLADVQPQVSGAELFTPGQIHVSFHNTAKVPATRVTFEVAAWGAPVMRIDDVGTFSQGVTVDQIFPNTSGRAHETISVAAVQFADGSVWHNDDAAPQQRLQAVSQLDLR